MSWPRSCSAGCRRCTDRSRARSALGQMAHSPKGLLRADGVLVGQFRRDARWGRTMAKAQGRDVTRPPPLMELGVEIGCDLLEAILTRFPQRTDRVDLCRLAQMDGLATHR